MGKHSFLPLLLLLSAISTGCVHRRVTIDSLPQGALVMLDGKDIGYTPTSFDFTWYGGREVQLLKDGYDTHTQLIRVDAPWYQRFPLDFLSDNFAGRYIEDHRRFRFKLQPRTSETPADVVPRANAMRSEALHSR
ncbi:MAG: PEGA domain-containing protein [Planctomycetaceae bacterium]|jgi:hypothetical protein